MNNIDLKRRTSQIIKQIIRKKNYLLYDQWKFVYLIYDLYNQKLKFGNKYHDSIFLAKVKDLQRIKKDIYPNMLTDYDTRYFERLGNSDVKCFLCEQDAHLIHYSFLFYNLYDSPLRATPFSLGRLFKNSVMWGPTFTLPNSRGMIYPYIFSRIVNYLILEKKVEYIVIFAYKDNSSAIPFYQNLGFKKLSQQPSPGAILLLLRALDSFFSNLIQYSKFGNIKK